MKIQPVEISYIVGIDTSVISLDKAVQTLTSQEGVTITDVLNEMDMILVRSASPLKSFKGLEWVEEDKGVSAL